MDQMHGPDAYAPSQLYTYVPVICVGSAKYSDSVGCGFVGEYRNHCMALERSVCITSVLQLNRKRHTE